MPKKPNRYSGVDSRPWKVITRGGQVFRNSEGKLMNNFRGYKDAWAAAQKVGGVAVRA